MRGIGVRFATLVAAVIALGGPLRAVKVPPGGGVTFEQITLRYSGMPSAQQGPSRWARAVVDLARLQETTKLTRGFLNIRSPNGWVVPNWPLDMSEALLRNRAQIPPDTYYFQLIPPSGAPRTVTSEQFDVQFTGEPIADPFLALVYDLFPVAFHYLNAEGVGPQKVTAEPVPTPPGVFVFEDPAGETFSHILPYQVNVEAALNQCFPMSIANSLQHLEERFGITVPNDHVSGQGGDGKNTLVGKLDELSFREGSGVGVLQMIDAKFRYVSSNGLAGSLVHRHQGRGFGGPLYELPNGDFTAYGVTSKDDGEKVTWFWICEQIKAGEDVEVGFSYDNAAGQPNGGHAVRIIGCGKTRGVPWLKYLHDGTQANNSFGLETPTVYATDMDGDGLLNFGSLTTEVRFAISESVSDKIKGESAGAPQIKGSQVANAASFSAKSMAPGSLVTVFGQFAGLATASAAQRAAAGPEAGTAIVTVNGRTAPIFFAGTGQINFQLPEETELGTASLLVRVNGRASDLVTLKLDKAAPGIFLLDASIAGPGRGVIQNQDFSLNVPGGIGKPAAPGSAIVVYMTGLGELSPALATGARAPADPLSRATATVTATVGGKSAQVLFAGATPGFTGLHQVNVLVPDLAAGDADLTITVGGVASNTVKVAIGSN